jgi:hypothetical protein
VTTLATSLRHDSFTLTRHFEAAPAAVWQLFADEATWRRWFKMPGSAATYTHDSDRRLTYAYVAIVDGIPRWSALVTVELADDGDGTLLSWTEQVAVLHASDGSGDQDLAHLRGGVRLRFNAMTVALRGTP